MTAVVLDVVEKTNDVGVRRKKLVPRSDRLESKEKKIPENTEVRNSKAKDRLSGLT